MLPAACALPFECSSGVLFPTECHQVGGSCLGMLVEQHAITAMQLCDHLYPEQFLARDEASYRRINSHPSILRGISGMATHNDLASVGSMH